MRRYCAANRLNRLGTLTYAGEGCHDPLGLRGDVAEFFKELRAGIDAGALPYLWVPEWHPGGHGLHAHFARRPLRSAVVDRAGVGSGVRPHQAARRSPVGSGARAEARMTARYLAGYAGRELGDERRPAGLHRYEVAQGFQPEKLLVYGVTADDVIERASGHMHAAPERVWLSSSVEGWRGPPACWAQWE